MNEFDTRHRILLAVDDATDRRFASESLMAAGCVVAAVAAGPELAAAAAAQHYTMILMDLARLGPDGLAAVGRIRRLPDPRRCVPILALVATPAAADHDRYVLAGLDGLVPKPVDAPRLLEVVAHWAAAGADPTWGLDPGPGIAPPLLNRRTLAQMEEDVGPGMLPELVVTFLEEARRRLGLLEEQVAAGDLPGVAAQAHALKGSAGTFGAMALRQVVDAMEQGGRAGDGARIGALLPPVQRLVARTCDLLRAEYSVVP